MADQQPGDAAPAAGPPDPIRAGAPVDEPSTVDAPVRWSGSAAVPPPAPKKSRWPRRRTDPTPGEPAEPADRAADNGAADNGAADNGADDDWAATPAVDPWEGQDTPWDPMPLPVEVVPPTRVESPPAAPPPTRIESPAAAPSPPAAPKRRWGRKRQAAPTGPVNRVPVAPRSPAPQPQRPPFDRPAAQRSPQPRGRQMGARPLPPSPTRRPPDQRPLPPPPRRRRWPRNLAVFTLLSAVCCCGIPAVLIWPASGQYPVSAVLPASVSDLELRDDDASLRAAEQLSRELHEPGAFAGIYTDGNGKRVTVFGTTGLRLTPRQDLEARMAYLTAKYDLRDVQPFDVGEPGVHERCGVGRSAGTSVVVCAWADHGSLVTVLLTRRSVSDSAELTGVLRSVVLTHG